MGLKLTYIHNIKHKVGEQIPDHIHSSMEIVLYRRSNGHTVINEKQYRPRRRSGADFFRQDDRTRRSEVPLIKTFAPAAKD